MSHSILILLVWLGQQACACHIQLSDYTGHRNAVIGVVADLSTQLVTQGSVASLSFTSYGQRFTRSCPYECVSDNNTSGLYNATSLNFDAPLTCSCAGQALNASWRNVLGSVCFLWPSSVVDVNVSGGSATTALAVYLPFSSSREFLFNAVAYLDDSTYSSNLSHGVDRISGVGFDCWFTAQSCRHEDARVAMSMATPVAQFSTLACGYSSADHVNFFANVTLRMPTCPKRHVIMNSTNGELRVRVYDGDNFTFLSSTALITFTPMRARCQLPLANFWVPSTDDTTVARSARFKNGTATTVLIPDTAASIATIPCVTPHHADSFFEGAAQTVSSKVWRSGEWEVPGEGWLTMRGDPASVRRFVIHTTSGPVDVYDSVIERARDQTPFFKTMVVLLPILIVLALLGIAAYQLDPLRRILVATFSFLWSVVRIVVCVVFFVVDFIVVRATLYILTFAFWNRYKARESGDVMTSYFGLWESGYKFLLESRVKSISPQENSYHVSPSELRGLGGHVSATIANYRGCLMGLSYSAEEARNAAKSAMAQLSAEMSTNNTISVPRNGRFTKLAATTAVITLIGHTSADVFSELSAGVPLTSVSGGRCSPMSPLVLETRNALTNGTQGWELSGLVLPSVAGCVFANSITNGQISGELLINYSAITNVIPIVGSYVTVDWEDKSLIYAATCGKTQQPGFGGNLFYTPVRATDFPGLDWNDPHIDAISASAVCDIDSFPGTFGGNCVNPRVIALLYTGSCADEPFSSAAACMVSCDGDFGARYTGVLSQEEVVTTRDLQIFYRRGSTVTELFASWTTFSSPRLPGSAGGQVLFDGENVTLHDKAFFAERGSMATPGLFGNVQMSGPDSIPVIEKLKNPTVAGLKPPAYYGRSINPNFLDAMNGACSCTTQIFQAGGSLISEETLIDSPTFATVFFDTSSLNQYSLGGVSISMNFGASFTGSNSSDASIANPPLSDTTPWHSAVRLPQAACTHAFASRVDPNWRAGCVNWQVDVGPNGFAGSCGDVDDMINMASTIEEVFGSYDSQCLDSTFDYTHGTTGDPYLWWKGWQEGCTAGAGAYCSPGEAQGYDYLASYYQYVLNLTSEDDIPLASCKGGSTMQNDGSTYLSKVCPFTSAQSQAYMGSRTPLSHAYVPSILSRSQYFHKDRGEYIDTSTLTLTDAAQTSLTAMLIPHRVVTSPITCSLTSDMAVLCLNSGTLMRVCEFTWSPGVSSNGFIIFNVDSVGGVSSRSAVCANGFVSIAMDASAKTISFALGPGMPFTTLALPANTAGTTGDIDWPSFVEVWTWVTASDRHVILRDYSPSMSFGGFFGAIGTGFGYALEGLIRGLAKAFGLGGLGDLGHILSVFIFIAIIAAIAFVSLLVLRRVVPVLWRAYSVHRAQSASQALDEKKPLSTESAK